MTLPASQDGSSGARTGPERPQHHRVRTAVRVPRALAFSLLLYVTAAGGLQHSDPQTSGGQAASATPPPIVYVQPAKLSPRLEANVRKLGDRLIKPGKERMILDGKLTRGAGSTPVSVKLIWELPNLFRYEEQTTAGTVVVAFDGTQVWKSSGAVSAQDADLLETVFNDSTDHFFMGQMSGVAMRRLGYFFRLDDGKSRTYTGPYYDIYQTVDPLPAGGRRPKLYYFNSKTGLLERVRYDIQGFGGITNVEVRIGDWRSDQGQHFPGSIQRSENGQPVLSFNLSTAAYAAKTADGIFTKP